MTPADSAEVIEARRIGECLTKIFEFTEGLKADYSEQNIASALTMFLQGFGITPEQYTRTFDSGRAIYSDFQSFHTDDDGSMLPPPGTTP